jgi:Protein of unknown function (DUF3617)
MLSGKNSGELLNSRVNRQEAKMRNLILWALVCLSASIIFAAGKFQPLNVKTGTWQTTWVTTLSGAPPIPQEMLDKMTPEQRARFDAMMKNMKSGTPRTRSAKTCLTRDQLEKNPFNTGKDCTDTVLSSTGSKMEIEEVCTEEDSKSDSKIRIEATDSENVKGWMQSTVTGSGRTMSVNATFTSKWIGTACTDKH